MISLIWLGSRYSRSLKFLDFTPFNLISFITVYYPVLGLGMKQTQLEEQHEACGFSIHFCCSIISWGKGRDQCSCWISTLFSDKKKHVCLLFWKGPEVFMIHQVTIILLPLSKHTELEMFHFL